MTIARVYKSRERYMQVPTPKWGLLSFVIHELLVPDTEENQEKIEFIEKYLLKDSKLRIFIDPNRKTVELEKYIAETPIKSQEIAHFLEVQNQVLPESHTDQGGINLMATSSVAAKGVGAPAAHRFNAAEVKQVKQASSVDVLRAKLSESQENRD